MSLVRRLINLVRSDRYARDLDRELAFHITERADQLVAAGMSPAAAHDEARRRFGNYGLQKERARDADVLGWLDVLVSDVRYALRGLRNTPVLALVAILSLGLGIGANTAIFSLIDAIVLRSLPVSHPESLVRVEFSDSSDTFTNPIWEQVRDHQTVFDGAFAYGENDFDLGDGGIARKALGAFTSGEFFSTLGVQPAVGRLFAREDDARGCAPVAVLGYGFWQSAFGGRADVVGRTVLLERHPVPIIGVAAQGFTGIDVGHTDQLFVPICAKPVLTGRPNVLDARSTWWLRIVGRMKPSLTIDQARAGLVSIAPATFSSTLPANWPPAIQARYLARSFTLESAATGFSDVRGSYTRALVVLMTIVALVLLIACANVANLLLARATTREREVAVRTALGASRVRIARQMLTESVILAFGGAALGFALAQWGSRLLVTLMSSGGEPISLDVHADFRVLLFTVGAAAGTAIIFGTLPAWRAARVHPNAVLKSGGRSSTDGPRRFAASKALVVAQIAISLVLVVGAGLLVGTFRKLAATDLGFRAADLLAVTVEPPRGEIADVAHDKAFYAQLQQSLQAIPGVRSASTSRIVPMSHIMWNDVLAVDGYSPRAGDDSLADFNAVSETYFATMGTPLLSGRPFRTTDRVGGLPVAIVNETLARKFFHSANVTGRTLRYGVDKLGAPVTIVGVAADAKYASVRDPAPPTVYLPVAQDSEAWGSANAELRVAGSAASVEPAVVAAIARFSPHAAVTFRTMESHISDSLRRERALAVVSGFFGALALLLAVLGLYGVMSYAVARRRAEIGIRIALGAGQRRVATMVVREVSVLLVLGLVVGLGGAFVATRLIASFLYGLSPMDGATMAGSIAALSVVALGAAYLPARRAARVDPMDALREE